MKECKKYQKPQVYKVSIETTKKKSGKNSNNSGACGADCYRLARFY